MKNLIVIGHPDKKSFCYNGIFKTIQAELTKHKEDIEIIDLYKDESFYQKRKKSFNITKT
jgi:putative NADPH-quinone reductase